MNHERFADYIRRFNAQDPSAFEDYLTPDVAVQNGTLKYTGIEAMKAHYARIWSGMKETLDPRRVVCDGDTLAVELHARFEALKDDPDSLFGPVVRGEAFDYTGVIMYRIRDGRFADIRVAYLDFVHTDVQGRRRSLGIPH
ncbi:nuclear transport factor 2 family protein [Castellaniella defragrans]|uniref:SnoaL-like domain-containing protein n=1 Tax=Castellaniella defragrans TaxID=75697 RepID=A0A7W9TMM3_CASDE|nr:nuclear transport factor 2 family protein [Castellaniella defragrans]KAB0622588.1 nuclear transport factor 2 family protein [Castellaniella defragrans]MBB6082996.1 hypothetical protein [Castellaniella defragrans]